MDPLSIVALFTLLGAAMSGKTTTPITVDEWHQAEWDWFKARGGWVPIAQFVEEFSKKGLGAGQGKGDLRWLRKNGHLEFRRMRQKLGPSGFLAHEARAVGTGPAGVTAREG